MAVMQSRDNRTEIAGAGGTRTYKYNKKQPRTHRHTHTPTDTHTHTRTHAHTQIEHYKNWAEAHIKIARMTLTIKLDRNWSSFQLANSAPPLSVTDSAIAPSARINTWEHLDETNCKA